MEEILLAENNKLFRVTLSDMLNNDFEIKEVYSPNRKLVLDWAKRLAVYKGDTWTVEKVEVIPNHHQLIPSES